MVVRMRKNSSQTKMRRSHHGISAPDLSVCKNCGASHRPHHMCLECGFYNGRQVLDLEASKAKREARLKAKKEAIAGAQAEADAPEEAAETASEVEVNEESKSEDK